MKPAMQLLSAVAIFSILTANLFADDWTQFRGPNGIGKSKDAKLPAEWDEETNLKWKTAMPGFGSSSPIVYGDRAYLTCYSGYGLDKNEPGDPNNLKKHLVCVNLEDGKIIWTTNVALSHPEDPYAGFIQEHGYASNTPVTDGEAVYAYFGKGGLFAYDLNGKEMWKKDLGSASGKMKWGSAASPIVVDDLVIVNANEESNSIRAFNKKTGEEAWKIDAEMELAYSTPAIATLSNGKKELVIALPAKVIGVDPATGKENWFAKTHLLNNVTPCPIVDGDIAYLYGGYQGVGSMAIRCGGEGDVTESNIIWKSKDSSYVGTPVLHDGHIYWVNAGGIAYCADAKTDELVYKERVDGLTVPGRMAFYASMVAANDRIYALSRKNGMIMIAAKPEFEQIGINKFESDSSDFNATPTIIGNQILIRSDKALYCVGK
jgi:outer membrane protein assembly factor BamB